MDITDLSSLERESIKRGIPIIGKEKGRWLFKKIQELQPKKILELGTANGYSGIILGSTGADLTTVEINPNIAEEAMIHFSQYNTKAQIFIGDAVSLAQNLSERQKEYYNLIFIHFAKKEYIKVLPTCLELVKKKGYIIADNITMKGCQDFKNAVLAHPQLKTEIINIKDGLSCSQKM